jgi:hypothetical protein
MFTCVYADDRNQDVPMKFCKVSIFFALLVAVSLPAVAQRVIQFDIPFNFSAAGKSLPAGHYEVAQVFDGDSWRSFQHPWWGGDDAYDPC